MSRLIEIVSSRIRAVISVGKGDRGVDFGFRFGHRALDSQQPLNSAACDFELVNLRKLPANLTRAKDPVRVPMNVEDQTFECVLPLGQLSRAPGVVGGARDSHDSAEQEDGIVGLLSVDELASHLISLAKKAAAFFRISRSCLRMAFSFLSLASSDFSVESRPCSSWCAR